MKYLVFPVILSLIFIVWPQLAFAGTFVFTEEFNSASKIDTNFSRVKIISGRVFTSDDSSSSRIESKTIKKTSYDIIGAVLNSTYSIPSTGGEIIYYLSNNGGDTWEWTKPGLVHDFQSQGRELRWAAVITRPSKENQSPFIESIRINFSEGGLKLKDKNDSKRMSDLNKVSTALKKYFKDRNDYPYVGGATADVRWRELGLILTKKNRRGTAYISKMPESILSINNETVSYDYGRFTNVTSEKGYVLAVTLENSNNKKLAKDIDGAIGGINCNDSAYCIIGGISNKKVSNGIVLGTQDIQIVPGSLVRLQGDNKIYYITQKGLKRHVPNEGVFLSYGNKWSDVLILPGSTSAKLSSTPENKFIFLEFNRVKQVYYINKGKKYYISPEFQAQLGLHDSEIAPVNSTELNAYPLDILTQSITEEIKLSVL
ncbi:MAG: hypothetical protein Q8Q06_01100 [bacterium]|nr:hypothetical protein [bacterium]